MNNKDTVNKIKIHLQNNGLKISWLSKKTGINWYDRLTGRTEIKLNDLILLSNTLNVKLKDLIA